MSDAYLSHISFEESDNEEQEGKLTSRPGDADSALAFR